MNTHQVSRFLGWFSLALGAAEILAPRQMCRLTGVAPRRSRLLPWLGVREIASGVGLLLQPRQRETWLWSRVLGDAMDLGLLTAALRDARADRRRLEIALAAVAGVTALDIVCSAQLRRAASADDESLEEADGRSHVGEAARTDLVVRRSVTINKSADDIYAFCRHLENLPRFMPLVETVHAHGDGRLHWVINAPGGRTIEWDVEITEDRPGEHLAWRTLSGAPLRCSGSMHFQAAPGGRGTMVTVEMRTPRPQGVVGKTLAKIASPLPDMHLYNDLHRLKQLLETGEIARTAGQPAGRKRSTSRKYDDFIRV